jgi:uncharacterized membrane protein
LYKTISILYLVCLGIYIFYTREPDYLDSEIYPARVHYHTDKQPYADFTFDSKPYSIQAINGYTQNQVVSVIFNPAQPATGKLYTLTGYWINLKEILVSLAVYIALFLVARSITDNPTPEAVMEQMEPRPKKRKYSGNTW